MAGRQSFENTSKWIDDVKAERGDDVVLVLVGNKIDIDEKRYVILRFIMLVKYRQRKERKGLKN